MMSNPKAPSTGLIVARRKMGRLTKMMIVVGAIWILVLVLFWPIQTYHTQIVLSNAEVGQSSFLQQMRYVGINSSFATQNLNLSGGGMSIVVQSASVNLVTYPLGPNESELVFTINANHLSITSSQISGDVGSCTISGTAVIGENSTIVSVGVVTNLANIIGGYV